MSNNFVLMAFPKAFCLRFVMSRDVRSRVASFSLDLDVHMMAGKAHHPWRYGLREK